MVLSSSFGNEEILTPSSPLLPDMLMLFDGHYALASTERTVWHMWRIDDRGTGAPEQTGFSGGSKVNPDYIVRPDMVWTSVGGYGSFSTENTDWTMWRIWDDGVPIAPPIGFV